MKGYIEIINSGHLPKIENAWVYVCRSEGMKASSEAIRRLEGKIEEKLLEKGLYTGEELAELRSRLEAETMKLFR